MIVEKAQKIAPLNVNRLCMLADVEMEAGNDEAASASVQAAQSLDKDAAPVQEVSAKLAVATMRESERLE